MLQTTTGLAQVVSGASGEVLVGASRWDAWCAPIQGTEFREKGGPGKAVQRSLSPGKYHFRVPFFGEIVSDTLVRIDGYTQDIMDREIEYARQGGLDYWAFLLYHPESSFSEALSYYLSSKKRDKINFCFIVRWADYFCDYEGFGSGRNHLIKLLKEPGYQKVIDGRPIICMYQPQHLWEEKVGGIEKARKIFDSFREESIKANCGNPYLVVMDGNLERGKTFADIIGADAISSYGVSSGGINAPYSELTKSARNRWMKCEKQGVELVPFATTGFNAECRIEMKDPIRWLTQGQTPYGGKYNVLPTLEELTTHIKDAIFWTGENKKVCPAQTIIIYSWNEHDEGGWLCPTLDENNQVDNSRLKGLKEVLESIK